MSIETTLNIFFIILFCLGGMGTLGVYGLTAARTACSQRLLRVTTSAFFLSTVIAAGTRFAFHSPPWWESIVWFALGISMPIVMREETRSDRHGNTESDLGEIESHSWANQRKSTMELLNKAVQDVIAEHRRQVEREGRKGQRDTE